MKIKIKMMLQVKTWVKCKALYTFEEVILIGQMISHCQMTIIFLFLRLRT